MTAMTKHPYASLAGKTIADVRSLNPEEMEWVGWEFFDHRSTTVLEFSDGSYALVMADAEGNGPGALEVMDND